MKLYNDHLRTHTIEGPAPHSWNKQHSHFRGVAATEHIFAISMILLGAIAGTAAISSAVKNQMTLMATAVTGDSTVRDPKPSKGNSFDSPIGAKPTTIHRTPVVAVVASSVAILAIAGGFLAFPYIVKKNSRETRARNRNKMISAQRLLEKRERIYRNLSSSPEVILRNKLLVGHVMSANVYAVHPSTTRSKVQETLQSEFLHHLIVCDRDAIPLGVISDRDLTKANARIAADMMSADIMSARVDDPIEFAISVMIQNRISCLPVLESSGRLRGIITSSDLLLTLQCALHLFDQLDPRDSQNSTCGNSLKPTLGLNGVIGKLVIRGNSLN